MTSKSKRLTGIIVLVLAIIMSLFTTAFSVTGSLNGNGNADVEVYVTKQKVEDMGISTFDEFKTYFEGYVRYLNLSAKDEKPLNIESYTQTEDGYLIEMNTRRISAIVGLGRGDGSIQYREGSVFATLATDMSELEYMYDWVEETLSRKVYTPSGEQTTIKYEIVDESVYIEAQKRTENGFESMEFEQFSSYLENTKDKIVRFVLGGLSLIETITLKVNGRINYVSSEGIEVIGKDTVKISAVEYSLKNGGSIGGMIGYFTFSENLSPFAIGCIIVGCIALGVLIFCFIKFKWIQRFFASDVWGKMKKYKVLYLMLIPGFVLLVLFHYLPLGGLITAFQRYNVLDGYGSEFIGFQNFSNIFFAATSDKMYRIFRNTIFISLIRIVTNFPIILLLALVVQSIKNKHVKAIFQAISFIPYFISWTAVSGMAFALLEVDSGILNNVIELFGGAPVNWYGSPDKWWGILAISSLWKGMGWGTLIYIAAMCNIDGELYEACALDGGGALRQAFSVTLPSIMTVVCLQLILDAGSIMKDNYEQIIALIPGDTTALNETIEVIGKYTYSELGGSGMGAATAMGLIQSVIGLILVLFVNMIVKKTDNEGIL